MVSKATATIKANNIDLPASPTGHVYDNDSVYLE